MWFIDLPFSLPCRILQHNYPYLLSSRSFSDSGRLNDPQLQILEAHPVERVSDAINAFKFAFQSGTWKMNIIFPLQTYRTILEPPDEKQEIVKEILFNTEDENNADCTTELLSKSEALLNSEGCNSEGQTEEAVQCGKKSVIFDSHLGYLNRNGLKIDSNCLASNCISPQLGADDVLFNQSNTTDLSAKAFVNNNIDLVNGKNVPNGDMNQNSGLPRRLSLPAGSQSQQGRKLPTSYLRDLRVHRHSLTYRGAMLNINRYRLRASSCPDIYRNSMTTIAKEKDEVSRYFKLGFYFCFV